MQISYKSIDFERQLFVVTVSCPVSSWYRTSSCCYPNRTKFIPFKFVKACVLVVLIVGEGKKVRPGQILFELVGD